MKRSLCFAGIGSAAIALLVACTQEDDMGIELDVPSPVALGATVTATVKGGSGKALMDQPSIDDGSVFTIVDNNGSSQKSQIQLRATKAGSTTFRARGDNGRKIGTIEEDIEAASPTRVAFQGVIGCSAPYRIGAGATFTVNANRFKGSTALHGTGGVFPIDSDIAGNNGQDSAQFTASMAPGSGWIRSKVDVSRLPVEVVGATKVTSMTIDTSSPIAIGAEARLETHPAISGERLCADAFPREVTTTTPAVCEIREMKGSTVVAFGKAGGTCEVAVTLAGTTVSAKTTFFVQGAIATTDAGGGDASATDDAGGNDAGTD
jgi:hypothetical protein